LLSLHRSIASVALMSEIVGRHYLGPKPLVRRSLAFDFLPQYPSWFCNSGHTSAKVRFLHKLRARGATEKIAVCPHCSGGNFRLLATQERSGLPTSVNICLDCALVFTNPRLSNKFLRDHYIRDYRDIERGSRDDLHEFMFNLQASKGPILWEFIRAGGAQFSDSARITDIGCGEGGLVDWFCKNSGAGTFIGFELNGAAADYGRAKGLDVRAVEFSPSDGPYDLVVLEQVLEHLSSPGDLLAAIAGGQKAGAWLYIGVPGVLNFPKGYDHNFIAYLQYGHMFHYCLYTLERLLVPFGYRLAKGTDVVQALFQKVDTPLAAPTTPKVSADAIIRLLQASETEFGHRDPRVHREWPYYKDYSKLMIESWRRSFTSLPL
jgi:SAM-dependent methyltransferase